MLNKKRNMKNLKNVEEKLPKIEVIPCYSNEVFKNDMKEYPDKERKTWDFGNGDSIGPYPSFIKGKDFMMTGLREGLLVGYLLDTEVS